jgi:hypothetical protein
MIFQCIRGDDANDPSSLDPDEVANTSEAYEENDVLFFDNHVDKRLPVVEDLAPPPDLGRIIQHQEASPRHSSPSKKPKPRPQMVQLSTTPSLTTSAPSPTSALAVNLSDDTLITMLSQPPKSIPQMRTKSSFQDFFRGISEERMKQLLRRAYGNLNDLEREVKVKKRMELLADVLSSV